jgi:hypothetical protein
MANRPFKPPALTPRGREIVSFMLNTIAFQTHDDDGELETMAGKLGTTAAHLRPMLRKLEAQGWLSVEGTSIEFVYPTIQALRWQNPALSDKAAEAIVRKLHR